MMNWIKKILFGEPKKRSAQVAHERLKVIVAHERGRYETQPDFLPRLQKEITEVIAKYVKVNQDQVRVDFEQKGGRSVLELNITFPDQPVQPVAEVKKARPAASVAAKPAVKKSVASGAAAPARKPKASA